MSDYMSSDEKIQSLFNKSKNLRSPTELDDIILGKIRAIDEETASVAGDKRWLYIPIAASILLGVLLQFNRTDNSLNQLRKPVEIAHIAKKKPTQLKKSQRRQLPELFFLPTEDINNKVVRACTGGLVTPEERIAILNKGQKGESNKKASDIPLQQMYPNDVNKNKPKCDGVSSQVFKN